MRTGWIAIVQYLVTLLWGGVYTIGGLVWIFPDYANPRILFLKWLSVGILLLTSAIFGTAIPDIESLLPGDTADISSPET